MSPALGGVHSLIGESGMCACKIVLDNGVTD